MDNIFSAVLGAGSTTTATLFVLYEHEGGMLVVAACQAGFLGYYHDGKIITKSNTNYTINCKEIFSGLPNG